MKSFDEIYSMISKETFEKLEVLRKKDSKSNILSLLLVIAFILASIFNFYIGKFVILCEIIMLFVFYKISRLIPKAEFEDKYKKEIIKPIVESYDNEITYNFQGGITEQEYSETGYRTGNEFYSSDYFETKDGKIRASHISIIDVRENKDGEKERRTIFSGLFCILTLDNFSEEVISLKIDSKLRNILSNSEKIEVDSAEFERDFDLYCKNRTYAMEIFTSDILILLSEFSKKNDTMYDFLIKGNKLYVRYHKSTVFDIDAKKALQKESIENTYESFYKMMDSLIDLQKNIDEKIGDLKIN